MSNRLEEQSAFWNEFISSHPEYRDTDYVAEQFGWGSEVSTKLADLIKDGAKQATSSLLCLWEEEGISPTVGMVTMILDGEYHPVCIIETESVCIMPFSEITEEMAALEGEGDLSLEYWRRVHREAFSKDLEESERPFDDHMHVVFERFRVIV